MGYNVGGWVRGRGRGGLEEGWRQFERGGDTGFREVDSVAGPFR
jgi:hypothetical protein